MKQWHTETWILSLMSSRGRSRLAFRSLSLSTQLPKARFSYSRGGDALHISASVDRNRVLWSVNESFFTRIAELKT